MSNYSAMILADNPIRYFRLNEGSGTVAHDLSSSGQNGTLGGTITLNQPALISGDSGASSMLFDGSSGSISVPTTGLPILGLPWSMEAWIKVPSPASGPAGPCIMGFGTTGTNQAVTLFYQGSNKQFVVATWNNVGVFTGTLLASQIYHLVGTYDRVTLCLYINGSLAGSSAVTFNLGSTFAQIGNDSTTNWFGGSIAEVAWYAYPLSASQVAKHYLVGKNSLNVQIVDTSGHIPGLAATYPPNFVIDIDAAGNYGGMQSST
jgi:hypothetical protein